jgi:hypothetical protein
MCITPPRVRPVLVCLCSFALAACGGGGGGGDSNNSGTSGGGGGSGGTGGSGPPPVTNNLAPTALQVLTANPRIAYPLTVSLSMTANEATDNVSVSLFAIEKNDDPNVDIRQIPIGNHTIERADAGARSYEIATHIPSSVELPGSYFIGVIVDPVEEIAETNEDDNKALIETLLAPEGGPNILIEEIVLDRAVIDVDTSTYEEQVPGTAGNVHNSDAGGTITVGSDGLAVDETIDLEGFASLRLTRSDVGTSHDVPLYLWNSEESRYMNAYGVDPNGVFLAEAEWLPLGEFAPQLVETAGTETALDDLNRDSVQLNFYFPGRLGKELETAIRTRPGPLTTQSLPTAPPPDLTAQAIASLRSFLHSLPPDSGSGNESAAMAVLSFAICGEIRPADPAIVDRDSTDNELCAPVSIMLPPLLPTPTPGPGGYTPHFSKPSGPLISGDGFATKGGGSAFAFGIDFGATTSMDNRGYIEELHGGVPVTVFGANVDFLKIVARTQLVPDYAGKPATEESGYVVELWFAGLILNAVDAPPTSSAAQSISYSKEAPDPERPYQAFVGPVPVIGGATVGGAIGIEYQFVFTGDDDDGYVLGTSVAPYANLEATLYAGVGTPLFSAGVEGVLTLLDERIVLFAGTEIEVINSGSQTVPAEFVITQGVKITNEFTGPRGTLNLYAKYTVPGLKDCQWGPIKGKCPTAVSMKATKKIWSSKALFELNDVLYENPSAQLDVVVRPGQAPAYYVP